MNYYTVSTSNQGNGAIFTNKSEAEKYLQSHPNAKLTGSSEFPKKIPSNSVKKAVCIKPTLQENTSEGSMIEIYTDGSAIGNPGRAGYGAIINKDGESLELSQGYTLSTNNRMEMMGVIKALIALTVKGRSVTIYSDSTYVVNSVNKGWAKSWRKNGWIKSDKKRAENPDLWKILLDLIEEFENLTFEWVKGHSGNPMNERADILANSSARDNESHIKDCGYKTK